MLQGVELTTSEYQPLHCPVLAPILSDVILKMLAKSS